jgi:hypothetical protein
MSQKEPKGAWKSRVEELPSYKRLRDEKKRKKTSLSEESGQHFVLLCITTRCIRAIKIVIRSKNKAEIKEIAVPFETRGRISASILQIARSSDEYFQVFASDCTGKVQIFALRLAIS